MPFFSAISIQRIVKLHRWNVLLGCAAFLLCMLAIHVLAQQPIMATPQVDIEKKLSPGVLSLLLGDESPYDPPFIHLPHISIERRVAGMALSAGGNVYAWYHDGTVTAGSPTSLDDYRSPYKYRTAPGREPEDIVAMAISSNDKVYTWYRDGTRSVGTSKDLDYYKSPETYQLPTLPESNQFYSPNQIVGITISGSDGVRTYFNNGMMTIGNSLNLGAIASNIPYATANNRPFTTILGIAHQKTSSETLSWYYDGYVTSGNTINLGANETVHLTLDGYAASENITKFILKGRPFSQHLTLYSFKTGLEQIVVNPDIFEHPGPVARLRSDLDPVHEAVLAPGENFVATARGYLSIFRKIGGETAMEVSARILFEDFLYGTTDPVRDINTFTGIQSDCINKYPQAGFGRGFYVWDAYDTRVAYDKFGKRFVFLANVRNYVWQGDNIEDRAPNGECLFYRHTNYESDEGVYVNDCCGSGRRHLLIAVSVSEDPADGFHLYAVKEHNYRDWPMLSVNEKQLIVGLKGSENPDGYLAIVFDLEQMRNGSKRPNYFKLYKEDIKGEDTILHVPRIQEGNTLTVGIGYKTGTVWGFSRFITGYTKPEIFKAEGVQLPPLMINWVVSHGALRVASNTTDSSYNNAYVLTYGRYPLTADPVNGLVVKTNVSEGASPYGPITFPDSEYLSYTCPRLAVTNNGDEVIAFAGVRSGNNSRVSYDAAFVKCRSGTTQFSAPEAYSTGTYTDSDSWYSNTGVTYYNEDNKAPNCQQQGGAERDPIHRRVWMMHSYGLELDGIDLKFRGALGWVEP